MTAAQCKSVQARLRMFQSLQCVLGRRQTEAGVTTAPVRQHFVLSMETWTIAHTLNGSGRRVWTPRLESFPVTFVVNERKVKIKPSAAKVETPWLRACERILQKEEHHRGNYWPVWLGAAIPFRAIMELEYEHESSPKVTLTLWKVVVGEINVGPESRWWKWRVLNREGHSRH